MNKQTFFKRHFSFRNNFGPTFIAALVLINGLFIITESLLSQLSTFHAVKLTDLSVDITLGLGLSLVYLSSLLRRRKRTAWIATAVAYTFYLGVNLENAADIVAAHQLKTFYILRTFILAGAILSFLLINHKKFVVKSDGPSFLAAFRVSAIIVLVTFVYGSVGFYTLGKTGFRQRLSIPAAMHYTIDQIGLTTNKPIVAHSRKARLFQDSLSFFSFAAFIYVVLSFFQPIKSRLGDQTSAREHFKQLILHQHDAVSEDFFKLWPHDKLYFFDATGDSGLAYHVYRGVAVILSGPAGKQARYKQLLSEFQYVCFGNDWTSSIVHCEDNYREIYKSLGYKLQKLGQEAVVDIHKFNEQTLKEKYFRNIVNKFTKQGYSYEVLSPPHDQQILATLRSISIDWLSNGNRAERGFTMGFYSDVYLNQCEVVVAKDASKQIQAFVNLVPEIYDYEEATYDMLRYTSGALGNVNDFLLISVCQLLGERGYLRLNLGFCPLAGIDEVDDKRRSLIDSVMSFAYANGDRFYSFSGLYRFKNKYAPEWRDRYIAYKGGIRGFSRALNASVQIMRITAKPSVLDRTLHRIDH